MTPPPRPTTHPTSPPPPSPPPPKTKTSLPDNGTQHDERPQTPPDTTTIAIVFDIQIDDDTTPDLFHIWAAVSAAGLAGNLHQHGVIACLARIEIDDYSYPQ